MLPESRFRSEKLAKALVSRIEALAIRLKRKINIMEVCGTHTMAIARYGIRSLLPKNIHLISGPGCPVCVTDEGYIDTALELAKSGKVKITTFGDMMRVPGSDGDSLSDYSDRVKVVYSPQDALSFAKETNEPVVFLAVGFETTAPTVAATVLLARKQNIQNFSILSAHKLIPPAMEALLSAGKAKIDAFICPGHVSTIIGSKPYEPLAAKYKTPCVVTGFEPLDILQAISMILSQTLSNRSDVEIQYRRVVNPDGNPKALEVMYSVFEVENASWRGIGEIPKTGLRVKDEFKEYDAERKFSIKVHPKGKSDKRCICGLIMQGLRPPPNCKLFGKECTPTKPVGPCMVSSEGSCAAFYKYSRDDHSLTHRKYVRRNSTKTRQ